MHHSWQYLFRDNRPPLDAPCRGVRHHHCPRRYLDLLFVEAITATAYMPEVDAKLLSVLRTQRRELATWKLPVAEGRIGSMAEIRAC